MQVGHQAAPLVLVRGWLRARRGAYDAVLGALSPAERRTFESFTASDWLSIELSTRLYELSAPALYPGAAAPLDRLGRDVARDNARGLLRFVLRTLTAPFVLEHAARLWRSFHRTGEARVERAEGRPLLFVVRDYPELTEAMREVFGGYLAELVELTGAKEASARSGEDAGRWLWSVTWQ